MLRRWHFQKAPCEEHPGKPRVRPSTQPASPAVLDPCGAPGAWWPPTLTLSVPRSLVSEMVVGISKAALRAAGYMGARSALHALGSPPLAPRTLHPGTRPCVGRRQPPRPTWFRQPGRGPGDRPGRQQAPGPSHDNDNGCHVAAQPLGAWEARHGVGVNTQPPTCSVQAEENESDGAGVCERRSTRGAVGARPHGCCPHRCAKTVRGAGRATGTGFPMYVCHASARVQNRGLAAGAGRRAPRSQGGGPAGC